jgi:hypothetical protein
MDLDLENVQYYCISKVVFEKFTTLKRDAL